MQFNALTVHPDVGNMSASRHYRLTDVKRAGGTYGFDSDINTFPMCEFHYLVNGVAMNKLRCAKGFRNVKSIGIDINHNDLGGRIELCSEERRKSNGSRANDGDRISRFDLTVEN